MDARRDQDGLHTFDVCVSDGTVPDCETITVTVNEVADPNSPPVLGSIGNRTVDEEVQLTFTATATDPDAGDTLAFSLANGASGLVPCGCVDQPEQRRRSPGRPPRPKTACTPSTSASPTAPSRTARPSP